MLEPVVMSYRFMIRQCTMQNRATQLKLRLYRLVTKLQQSSMDVPYHDIGPSLYVGT